MPVPLSILSWNGRTMKSESWIGLGIAIVLMRGEGRKGEPWSDRSFDTLCLTIPNRLDEYLSAAFSLDISLPKEDSLMHRHKPSWLVSYNLLLCRNFKSYIRNYGNVCARLAVLILVAILSGLVFWDLGARNDSHVVNDIFGK